MPSEGVARRHSCSSTGCCLRGFCQTRVVERGFHRDRLVGTALVNLFGRLQRLDEAWKIFLALETRDVVAWNAMLSALSEQQQWRRSLGLFHAMLLEGLVLDKITFLAALRACANLRDLSQAKALYSQICESGLEVAEMVGNAIVDMYGKCGSIEDALQAFERIPAKDVVSWNTMIAAFGQNGSCAEAVQLFQRMLLEGERAEKVTLATLLHSFASREFLEQAAIVAMYARCGSVDKACRMFDAIAIRDVVIWNTFISSLAQADLALDSFQVFRRMQLEGVRANKVTFATIIDVCTSLSSLAEGKLVTSLVLESGLGDDTVLGNAVIDLYGKCGSLENARSAFERMTNKDVVSWTTILAAYSQHSRFSESVGLFNSMLLQGLVPSRVTLVTALYACAGWKSLQAGKKIHACVAEAGLESNELVSSAICALYAECGDLEQVRRAFDSRQQQQDTTAWNAVIVALTKRGLLQEAVTVYRRMQMEGVPGDKFTLVSVLEACSELRLVRSIEARVWSWNLEHDDTINTALLKAYGQCGSMRDATLAFERSPKQDVVAWSAMVAVLAQHGCADAALELFHAMQLYGVMPNDISFVSVLSVCSHSGSVERARDYFASLEQDFGVKVTAEHWTCMIDLLGRAGRLGEAEDFLSGMEFEPDLVLWTTLLASCSVHGNFELGKRAAERMFELGDEEEVTHVVLASLHSSQQVEIPGKQARRRSQRRS